jgi:hypothetical protein
MLNLFIKKGWLNVWGFSVFIVLLLFAIYFGGGGCATAAEQNTTTTTSAVTTTTAANHETSQKDVSVGTGGTINFSDGTTVSFPAGAVTSDTIVTVNKLSSSCLPDQVLSAVYVSTIESLAIPATVTLRYDPSRVRSDQEIMVGVVGGANSQEAVSSSEVSVAAIVSPESIDTSTGTITVKTNHFSFVWAFFQEKAYLVFDFGASYDYKYLKPGDIIFALTGARGSDRGFYYDGSWTPGHVGMYLGTIEGYGIKHLIESTVAKDIGGSNGVQYGRSDYFKVLGHIYLGARRPKGVTLTDTLRASIVSNAKAKLGWPYFYLNFDSFGVPLASGVLAGPKTGITCVALVENSYNEAGVYNVSALRQYLFFPIDLFTKTEPVKDITVKVNDLVKFYVYGVTRNNYGTYSKWRTYLDQESFYNLSVSCPSLTITSYDRYPTNDDPDAATKLFGTRPVFFKKAVDAYGYTHGDNYPFFKWIPSSSEVGTYPITFTLDAGTNGTKQETMTITVIPK